MGIHHDVRFPGESEQYRSARDELLSAEIELRRQTARAAAMRRALPLGGEIPADYAFEQWDPQAGTPRQVRISELFAEGMDALFIYSFMCVPESQGLWFVGPCPHCTSIVDGIDGEVPHITRRINFAVASAGPSEQFHAHGQQRGWRNTRLLSTLGSDYSRDYRAEDADGNQWPLATVFVRRDGKVHHFWSSELWLAPREAGLDPRHVDFMWPIWAMLDRTPEGRDDVHLALDYPDTRS